MRINNVSSTMPMAVRNKQQNNNNSQNPNFGVKFYIANKNQDLLKSIDWAWHEKVSRYESRFPVRAGYPYTDTSEGFTNFLTNIVNICRPFKQVLPNKEFYFYDDEKCEDCGGFAPSGKLSLEVHPGHSHIHINCGEILHRDELEEKRKELADILIEYMESSPDFNPPENIDLINSCLNTRVGEVDSPVRTMEDLEKILYYSK